MISRLEIIAGRLQLRLGVCGPVSVEAAQLDKGRVELALLKPRQKLAAPGDDMGDVIGEAAVAEQHQYRIGKRTAFDPDLDPLEARQTGDPRRNRGAEHDRQRREMIGPARLEDSKLDSPSAVGGPGTDKIRHSGRLHCRLAEGALDQGIAADELAPVIGKKRVSRQGRAAVHSSLVSNH